MRRASVALSPNMRPNEFSYEEVIDERDGYQPDSSAFAGVRFMLPGTCINTYNFTTPITCTYSGNDTSLDADTYT